MNNFVIKEINTDDILKELENIGFDKTYRQKACDKYKYKNLKIFDLTLPQANILKQTALSYGADCAVHREVLTSSIEKTDVILGGSISQLKKICEKLKQQPFSLKVLAEKILEGFIVQKQKTKLVGILNLTPDSFSNDGIMDFKNAQKKIYELIEQGADMIDIGPESTRPFSKNIDSQEQIERLKLIVNEFHKINIPISIDTRSSEVAKFALDNGANFINDVSGGNFDSKMFEVISKYNAGVIIQHSLNRAEERISYNNVIDDVFKDLLEKLQKAKEKNITKIILDPGIGFGKSRSENIEILDNIEDFYSLNYPIMVGISRKSFLGLSDSENNELKDTLTLAYSYPLIRKKIDFLRVHNVKLHRQLLDSVI